MVSELSGLTCALRMASVEVTSVTDVPSTAGNVGSGGVVKISSLPLTDPLALPAISRKWYLVAALRAATSAWTAVAPIPAPTFSAHGMVRP